MDFLEEESEQSEYNARVKRYLSSPLFPTIMLPFYLDPSTKTFPLPADTYGWWFTGVWFQNKWNWPYDTTSTAREGWTDANALKQYDDGTRDDGDGTLPVGGGSVFGGQSVHGGAPGPTCPGC